MLLLHVLLPLVSMSLVISNITSTTIANGVLGSVANTSGSVGFLALGSMLGCTGSEAFRSLEVTNCALLCQSLGLRVLVRAQGL